MQKKREKESINNSAPNRSEIIQNMVENFYEIIKKKRESLNMKQEDMARKINEKLDEKRERQ